MNKQITIIGAGVAGLVAAINLEQLGYPVSIYDMDQQIGGRVQSTDFENYKLDHGFQVLLTEYPLVRKYLDYGSLNLQKFEPGSYIIKNNKVKVVGDPLRNSSLLLPTLFSGIGNLSDKWKIYRLTKSLKNQSIHNIFKEPEISTINFLKKYGFSDQIILDFFKPFFTGIFLENELQTSSRMFKFIFKMFAEGGAAIPVKGIQEIPNQLASKLKNTKIELNKKVNKIQGNEIFFDNGIKITTDYIIVATEASKLIPQLTSAEVKWKSTQTLYFEVEKSIFNKYMIGLFSFREDTLINSICFPKTKKAIAVNELLSVSVVKEHNFTEFELLQKIKEELKTHLNLVPIKYLKTFNIPKALPVLNDVRYSCHPSETQLTDHIYLAGDTLLNGSLNAAMLSGELAAQAVHEKITGTIL